jgi:hypothetical protein
MDKCTVISCTTVVHPSENWKHTAVFAVEEQALLTTINAKISNGVDNKLGLVGGDLSPSDIFEDNDDPNNETVVDLVFNKPETDVFTLEAYNKYLITSVLLSRGDTMTQGKVVAHARDPDNRPIGSSNSNPILDTHKYKFQFPNGVTDIYS